MLQRLRSAVRGLTAQHDIRKMQDRIYQVSREAFLEHHVQSHAKYKDSKNLNGFEYQLFSQSGQDGIITEIFRRIGTTNRHAIEIGVGVGGGLENNTVALLARGWTATWCEGSPELAQAIQKNLAHVVEQERLRVCQAIVTAENAAQLLRDRQVPEECDLLSIDIDGNDLLVWKSLASFRPRAVVIEYNSYFPADANWTMPYRADAWWADGGIEFGASLLALELAGREMGYSLVACDLTGSDAFFVRSDLCADHFQAPFTAAFHYEPMRYHLIQRPGYPRTFSRHFGQIE